MASIIRVKRSTGTAAPGSLNYGEVANTVGVGTHGNKGGRTFIGDNSGNPQEIGGRYYTDLLSIAPGLVAGQNNPTTVANGFVPILDANNKVDQWNVDNLKLDGNHIGSTNTDGDIIFTTNGSGEVIIEDDTFLTFGTSKDGKIEYDEDGTNRVQVTGAPWTFASEVQFTGVTTSSGDLYVGGDLYGDGSNLSGVGNTEYIDAGSVTSSGIVTISNTTASTSTTTGALVISGGVGIAGSMFVGENVSIAGTLTYEDVTNIDSVGLITARLGVIATAGRGVEITAGGLNVTAGIATFKNEVNADGAVSYTHLTLPTKA